MISWGIGRFWCALVCACVFLVWFWLCLSFYFCSYFFHASFLVYVNVSLFHYFWSYFFHVSFPVYLFFFFSTLSSLSPPFALSFFHSLLPPSLSLSFLLSSPLAIFLTISPFTEILEESYIAINGYNQPVYPSTKVKTPYTTIDFT